MNCRVLQQAVFDSFYMVSYILIIIMSVFGNIQNLISKARKFKNKD